MKFALTEETATVLEAPPSPRLPLSARLALRQGKAREERKALQANARRHKVSQTAAPTLTVKSLDHSDQRAQQRRHVLVPAVDGKVAQPSTPVTPNGRAPQKDEQESGCIPS